MRFDLKHKAKTTVKQNTGWFVLFTILYWVAIWLIGSIPMTISIILFPLIFILMVFELVFVAGADMAFLRALMVKNNQHPIKVHRDIVKPILRDSFKFTWAQILKGFYTMMWSLLLFFPGVYKGIAYSLTDYLLIDFPLLTSQEAITESRRMMRGRKWRYIWLNVRFIGWYLLIPLTLGLAYFYVKPYYTITMINFYEESLDEKGYPEKVLALGRENAHQNHVDLDQSSDDWKQNSARQRPSRRFYREKAFRQRQRNNESNNRREADTNSGIGDEGIWDDF